MPLLPMDYIEWLDNHGFDALSLRIRSFENGKGFFTAHLTLCRLGSLLHEPSTTISPEWAQKLQIALLSPGLADNCQCRCSTNSCTPLTFLLKGIITESHLWKISNLFLELRFFPAFLDIFGTRLDLRHHLASLRFLTFEALDIPHTCCGLFLHDDYSAENVEEIQNEHEYELELLEELLEELEVQMLESLQNSDRGLDGLKEFWERTWIGRVIETRQHLDGSHLSGTERQQAEDIGVVWNKASFPTLSEASSENGDGPASLEFWVKRLEEIEAQCN